MWHTTEMFQGTSVSATHPHVLYHANKTCPVADHDLFTSLFTVHTPFLLSCRSLLSPKLIIWDTHSNISCSECYEGIFLFRHSSHESLNTQVIHSSPSNWKQYTGVSPYQLIMFTQWSCYGNLSVATLPLLLKWNFSKEATSKNCDIKKYSFLRHSWYKSLMTQVIQTFLVLTSPVADSGGVRGVQMHPPMAASNVFWRT